MRMTRTAYYCSYTRDPNDVPRFSASFRTEAKARAEAKKIRQQGFWGAVEKHREYKEDYQNDSAWLLDRRSPSSSCVQQASRRTFARYSPSRKRAICLGLGSPCSPADRRICVSSLGRSRGGRSKARFPPARLLHAGGR